MNEKVWKYYSWDSNYTTELHIILVAVSPISLHLLYNTKDNRAILYLAPIHITMSASLNADALDKQGEFSSKVPASEPLTTKGVCLSRYPRRII